MPADGISAATFAKRRLRRVSVLWAIPDKQWLDYVIVGRPNAKHNRRRKIKVRHCRAWVAREQGATKQKCEMALNDSLCPGASVRRNAAILPVLGAKPDIAQAAQRGSSDCQVELNASDEADRIGSCERASRSTDEP